MELTDKQQRFCREYVVDCNGTQAAIRAGYRKHSARNTASKLLNRPEISALVQTLQQDLAGKLKINSELVLQELARIAFGNLHDFLKSGMQVKSLEELDAEKLKAISSIKITESEGNGSRKTTAHIVMHDKLGALKELARHLGIYEKDHVQRLVESPLVIYPGSDED